MALNTRCLLVFLAIIYFGTAQSSAAQKAADIDSDEKESVEVTCFDTGGDPVVAAEVYLFQHNGEEEGRYLQFGPFMSNMQGKVRCPTAVFMGEGGFFDRWIYARVPGTLMGVSRSVRWRSGKGINPEGKVILRKSQEVTGSVDVPEGFAPADVKVRIKTMHVSNGDEPFDYDSFPRTEQFGGLDTSLPEIFEAQPDMTGRFTLRDVPKVGRLYLVTQGEGLAEQQWMNSDRILEREIFLPVVEESVAWGHVVSPAGEGVADVEVNARLSGRGRLSPSYLTTFKTTTDDQGRFELRGLPHTEFVLSVTDPTSRWAVHPREDVLIASGEKQEFTIALEETVAVSGRVVDPDGNPVPFAAISILADSKESPGLDDNVTDEEGRYRLNVPPGKAKIYFNALPDGFVYPRPQIVQQLEIMPGQDDIVDLDFTLERDE